MNLEFVEPSKRYVDVIVPEDGFNEVATEMVAARMRGLLGSKDSGGARLMTQDSLAKRAVSSTLWQSAAAGRTIGQ